MTKERALELIRRGKIAAYIMSALCAAVVALALFLGADLSEGPAEVEAAIGLVASIFIMAAIGFGFHRKSRTAGVAVILLYVGGALSNENFFRLEAWNVGPASVLFAGLFIWICIVFLQATYGTFAYHRRLKEEDPSHKPTKGWQVALGSVVGLIILVVGGLELSERFGFTNSSRVLAGEALAAAELAELQEYEIIKPTDTVELIYAPVLFSISAEGVLITGDTFIAYEGGGPFDSVYIYEIPLRDIRQVEVLTEGDEFTDTVVEITFTDDGYVEISLPVTDGGDKAFISLLRSQIGADNESAS